MDVEQLKSVAERLTGWRRPSPDQLARLLRRARPAAYRFRDDGLIPNNPRWPLVIYRGAISLPRALDPAAVWEELFESNDWSGTWRGEIYDYLHYHSRTHEVLGIARGRVSVRLGGSKGRKLKLMAGDAVIIPAGTGHQSLSASPTFLAVGAYPASGTYDECGSSVEEHARAVKAIRKVVRPRSDPVFGAKGPLLKLWPTSR
jgi:uncharacterized protein YjlB